METGIEPERWAAMGERSIDTAFDILSEQAKAAQRARRGRGVVDGG